MKVLQLGKFYPILGGVEKVMFDLTAGLGDAGIDCDMLCAVLPGHGVENSRHTVILNDHARIICVPTIKAVAATTLSLSMISTLRHIAPQYDIIHVHHPDPMAALSLCLSGYKGRVILHWHSDILKQKTLLKFYKPLQSWLIRRADRIVGTTPVYPASSEALVGFMDKTVTIPIGITPLKPEQDKVRELKSRYPGKKIVFSIGRLISYKGFRYLVDAAGSLPDNYHIVIAGSGPLKSELEAQIRNSGVENKVTLAGRISDEEKCSWYGACDIYALSSIYKTEAFAIVQIEAMSCGRPVVATQIKGSGVPWVNADGISGINVPTCDGKALSDAIVRITADDTVHEKYCRGAAARFDSLFESGIMLGKCLELYRLVLQPGHQA